MSVCLQRDISALCPSVQLFWGTAWKRQVLCAGSRLMRFILKVPEELILAIHVVPMAVVPTKFTFNLFGSFSGLFCYRLYFPSLCFVINFPPAATSREVGYSPMDLKF
ncbi:hypothetical protein GOODEAATRI_021971 [Goodea atripinnis]|uniref:Uncharacterized protein n=1 Tax=Goodea atripinnis TaxID=208336 RepID=A0ABV0NY09_9TELE